MAVWQYRGELIPELWLIAKHGKIPEALDNYITTEDTNLDAIEDSHCWRDIDVPDDLLQRVSAIMPQRTSWTNDAFMFGDDQTSDFEIWYDQGEVDAIYFRWDLREPDLEVFPLRIEKRHDIPPSTETGVPHQVALMPSPRSH